MEGTSDAGTGGKEEIRRRALTVKVRYESQIVPTTGNGDNKGQQPQLAAWGARAGHRVGGFHQQGREQRNWLLRVFWFEKAGVC